MVGADISLLVYTDLPKQLLSLGKYGQGPTDVLVRTFHRCPIALPNIGTDYCVFKHSYRKKRLHSVRWTKLSKQDT